MACAAPKWELLDFVWIEIARLLINISMRGSVDAERHSRCTLNPARCNAIISTFRRLRSALPDICLLCHPLLLFACLMPCTGL